MSPFGPAFPRPSACLWHHEGSVPYTSRTGTSAHSSVQPVHFTGMGTTPHFAMKAKFSGIGIVDGRGKLNGSVMSKNRNGAYVRTKVTPVNPQTTFQLQARNRLTSLSQAWRNLTQAQRDAFDGAVGDFAKTDIFGDLHNPTGKNLFTRLNINLQNVGVAPITSPPSPAGGGAVAAGVLTVENDGAASIAYTQAEDGYKIQVWATPGVSAGKKFVKQQYRLLTSFDGAAASPFDAGAAYLARFGAPATGTRVSFRLVSVNEVTGEVGTPSEATTIVVPA